MRVYKKMANVSLSEPGTDHMRFFVDCRTSIFAHVVRMSCSNTIHVIPIAASSCVRGRPFSVLTYTMYGDVRVLIPVIPSTVGSWVEMIVIAADVTNAEMGMYGMNSMSHPRRRIPKMKIKAPARKDRV
jgi:hypothetical protein